MLHRPYSLAAPGRPSSVPRFRGDRLFPPATCRGDGAPSGAPVFLSCRTPFCDVRAPPGAPSRRFLAPGSALPGTDRARSPLIQAALAAFRPASSSHSRQPGVVPADGQPGPPGAGDEPARRRRTDRRFPTGPLRPMPHLRHRTSSWPHHRNVSRRRPQPSQARQDVQGQCGGSKELFPTVVFAVRLRFKSLDQAAFRVQRTRRDTQMPSSRLRVTRS